MYTKAFKLIIVSILLCIVAVLPGELYQGYLDQYNDFYETSFYLPDDKTADVMLRDLTSAANTFNIQIFKIYETGRTAYSACLDIYAEEEMIEILSSDYGISNGSFRSLFAGSTQINIHAFSGIPDELAADDATYYLYGDYDDAVRFKEALVDIYAGSFPKNEGFNDISSYQSMILIAWILIITVTVILGLYDLMCQKKEIFILTTMGTRKGLIYLKNVLIDTLCMSVIYLVMKYIIQSYEGKLSFDIYSDIMLIILLFANALIFLIVFRADYRFSTGEAASETKLLICNYVLCGIGMFLFMISISSCVALIVTSYSYKAQAGFFSENADYNWYQSLKLAADDVGYSEEALTADDEYSDQMLQDLLNKFLEENPVSFFYLCEGGTFGDDESQLFYIASSGTGRYLKEQISELAASSLEHDVYIITPQNSKVTNNDLNDLVDWLEIDSYEILYYSEPVSVIYRINDESPITDMAKNPTVVFYNHEVQGLSSNETFYEFFMGMLDDSDHLWSEFAETYGITYVATNAWDYYCYRWASLQRTILVNLVIVIIMAVIMILSVYVIVRLEFKVNAKELALKKIYGHTRFERFRRLYTIIGISGVACVIGLLILKYIEYDIALSYIFPVLLLAVVVECIFVSGHVICYEKKNLQSILKGGSV